MNKMTQKLIKDTDENRKAKYNVDKQGFLHENFYLILVGYLFLFAGIIVLIAGGIVYLRNKHKH